MNQTELVLMPSEDYQHICDTLRELLNTNALIPSWMASGMLDTVSSELNSSKKGMDWLLSGSSYGAYENDRITNLASYAFFYSKGPRIALFPNVKSVQMGAFKNNTSVEEARFPNSTYASNSVFQQATSLTKVDFGSIHTIMSTVFDQATSLTEIVLRKSDKVVTLSALTAFNKTPYDSNGSGGKIYVPNALIEDYKTATNWSVLYGYGNCEFVAIEGSEYE